MPLLSAACAYAERGFSVIPCIPGSKLPAMQWKAYQKRRASESEIRTWFGPGHRYEALAVVLGPISGGIFVRDFDVPGSYESWADAHPDISPILPTVRTRRGAHVYGRMSELADPVLRNSTVVKYTDGELRVAQCIVLVPPSRHPDGGEYTWLIPLPPGPLLEIDPGEYGLIGTPITTTSPFADDVEEGDIRAGSRHIILLRMAGSMRRAGFHYGAILAALQSVNATRVRPPYPERDLIAIARDISQKPPGPRSEAQGEAIVVRLDSVPRETVTWLWKPFLPFGKLAFLDGDPGVGKTWLGLVIAAAVSCGRPLPDHTGKPPDGPASEPRSVIYMNAEDGLGDTLAVRLDGLGADSSMIYVMNAIRIQQGADIRERSITIQDVDAIENQLAKIRPALIIVDPLQSYLGPRIDMNRANETRPVLDGLGRIAARYNTAVLILRHMRKAGGDKALYRGIGSIDFAGAARSIMIAERDPDDPTRRILAHAKCSVAREAESLIFQIDDNGQFFWCGLSAKTADQLQPTPLTDREESNLDKAVEFLREVLGPCPLAVEDAKAQARKLNIGERTLRRAAARSGVFCRKIDGIWCWTLKP